MKKSPIKSYHWSSALLILLFLVLLIALTPKIANAGGWTQPKGSSFIKVGHMFARTNQFYDENGNIVGIRTLGTYNTSLYAEHGFHERLTGIVYFPFYVRNTLNATQGRTTGLEIEPGATNNAPGDLDLGARFSLIRNKPFVLAVSLTLGVPTGDTDDENALLTGDGEFNQLLKLEGGFGAGKWYTAGSVGINNRTRGFSEEFRYDWEIGVKLLKNNVLAAFKLFGVESFNNGEANNNSMGLFANNVEYIAFGPELSWIHKDKMGLTVAYLTATKGRNVLATGSYSVGAFVKLSKRKK